MSDNDNMIDDLTQGMRVLRGHLEKLKEALQKIKIRARSTGASTAIAKQVVIDDLGRIAQLALHEIEDNK